jgi:hypothetical protein
VPITARGCRTSRSRSSRPMISPIIHATPNRPPPPSTKVVFFSTCTIALPASRLENGVSPGFRSGDGRQIE